MIIFSFFGSYTHTPSKHKDKFCLAKEAIFSISFFTCITATGGVFNNLSSINLRTFSLFSSLSLINISAILTSCLINGSSKQVVTKLKNRWNKAISY